MIVMSKSNLYFVETNKAGMSRRLFVRLSDRTIFYFGHGIEFVSESVGPYELHFRKKGDSDDGIYRTLWLNVDGNFTSVIERVIESGTQKEVGKYSYSLNKLLDQTKEWSEKDFSYWGEYDALNRKSLILPSFPDIAQKMKLNSKSAW